MNNIFIKYILKDRSGKEQQQQMNEENELILRDFFPEVWLFEDFQIGENGSLDLRLNAPHSVTEWRFMPKFWSPGRADVCRVPSQSLFIQRDGGEYFLQFIFIHYFHFSIYGCGHIPAHLHQ